MPVDPTNPDTFEDFDDAEDGATVATEIGVEAPEADAAEQHTDLAPTHDDPLTAIDPDAANEADRAEQARVVELDEDDYR
ncbi:hypothetical protein [Streptomyces huiliensis]|uniref:hypothetical protein n=1 Tax=Streptomyces huiliensis TaxID=2876027 RepID=UPI001CBF0B97|nr:hypothetical protein [Streptomyces huiliensis]MBZ4324299.1 hypothetical protein [Streptomyces huiliensis]